MISSRILIALVLGSSALALPSQIYPPDKDYRNNPPKFLGNDFYSDVSYPHNYENHPNAYENHLIPHKNHLNTPSEPIPDPSSSISPTKKDSSSRPFMRYLKKLVPPFARKKDSLPTDILFEWKTSKNFEIASKKYQPTVLEVGNHINDPKYLHTLPVDKQREFSAWLGAFEKVVSQLDQGRATLKILESKLPETFTYRRATKVDALPVIASLKISIKSLSPIYQGLEKTIYPSNKGTPKYVQQIIKNVLKISDKGSFVSVKNIAHAYAPKLKMNIDNDYYSATPIETVVDQLPLIYHSLRAFYLFDTVIKTINDLKSKPISESESSKELIKIEKNYADSLGTLGADGFTIIEILNEKDKEDLKKLPNAVHGVVKDPKKASDETIPITLLKMKNGYRMVTKRLLILLRETLTNTAESYSPIRWCFLLFPLARIDRENTCSDPRGPFPY
ncbi:hypothetical protein BJ684DRAFT_21140 [Piptocephalis cylindrospora]|uniref:Uncharacterized protein n=1 Tax=Piptocephalis cylindrospora TaxID=1907219 RepID=A0A4P9Y3A5_9FUNG|nr:hypothetical protein BJ684DRAFT_21140 [Piptocephalis cylindrospora]|eukprot:RKP12310.1 hypothetical protein BJ684DRAFT_21140 [Piptocephalis cylindrospora]